MKKLNSFVLINLLFLVWLSAQSIVAYYPFTGNANDYSGNSRNPTYNGASLTTDRFGNANSAYAFSGAINGHIEYSSTGLPETNRTISLWFQSTDLSSKPTLLSYGGNGCATTLLMAINSSTTGSYPSPQYLVTGHCNANNITYAYPTEPLNEWYHWVLTINGSQQKIYINGELKSTQNTYAGSTYTTNRELAFGVATYIDGSAPYTDGNLGYFSGKLDDIRIYDGALSEAQVIQLYQSESTGLVAYYPFNGNANDESGNGYHGTVSGAILTSDRFSELNKAYNFTWNGTSSDRISIPGTSALNFNTGGFTISSWFKFEGTSNTGYNYPIVSKHVCSENSGFIFMLFNNKLTFWTGGSGWSGYLSTTESFVDGSWYHAVATYDGINRKIYVNGILKASDAMAYTSINSAYIVLGGYNGCNGGFNGKVDDIRIYNKPLTEAEILSFFENESTCSDPLTAVITSSENTGPGTLRAAVGCIESGGTITWSPTLNRALLTAPLPIDKNVNILGPGPADNPEIIIDLLNSASGINFSSGAELNLNNVDITIRNHSENKAMTQGNGTLKISGVTTVDKDPYPLGTKHCDPLFPTEVMDVINPSTGRTWMDRNLGATQVATSSSDAASYGDLYQWGRFSDGHQCRNSATTTTTSSSDVVGHGDFILPPWPHDWRNPQNDNLWQGVNGTNNPCPDGYRLPTQAEMEAERQYWNPNNANGAFASPLKFPFAGYRWYGNGSINFNISGYWTSTVGNPYSYYIEFGSSAYFVNSNRALGFSVRCIKN